MSTSRSSRSVAALVHPTRQQLDELDALLQRMLELPVNQVDEKKDACPPAGTTPPLPPPMARGVSPVPHPVQPTPVATMPALPDSEAKAVPDTYHLEQPEMDHEPGEVSVSEDPLVAAPTAQPTNTLPVQPPHLFRNRAKPGVEDSLDQEAGETSETGAKPEDWIPLRSSWKPSAHTWPPLAASWQQAQQAGPHLRRDEAMTEPEPAPKQPQPEPIHVATVAPGWTENQEHEEPSEEEARPETILYPRPTYPFQESTNDLKELSPEPRLLKIPAPESVPEVTAGLPWLWRPLAWINCAFAAFVALAGPPGRWMTGPTGRAMLGVVGILCLLGAVGLLVADWLGWTW